MAGKSLRGSRVLEEVLLYSGQFGLFYALMQLIVEGWGFFAKAGHLLLLLAILVQAFLLAGVDVRRPWRWALYFLVPAAYSAAELFEGFVYLTNAAHVGFWIYALLSAGLTALKRAKSARLQYLAEALFVVVNVSIYVLLYFYFDTKKGGASPAELTILAIGRRGRDFLEDPTHWFVIFGGAVLAATIAFGRYQLQRIKERIAALFGTYVDRSLRDTVIERGEFTASKRELCVLFADIVGFTSLCEGKDAGSISAMLNVYFEYWNRAIARHGGTVDKYIGDSVMVLFGLEGEAGAEACERAARCALEAKAGWPELRAELARRGLPVPEGFGVGCHYGELIIGDIGSADRKNITVVGDTVNVASRLESATRTLGRGILLSEEVYARLGAGTRGLFAPLGRVGVKGKAAEIQVYGDGPERP